MLNNKLPDDSYKYSAVVTTFNSDRTIEYCLKSLMNQSLNLQEIIVVDNFSTDNTVEIVKKFNIPLHQTGPERSAQRNLGFKFLNNCDYFFYVDSDMYFQKDLVKKINDNLLEFPRNSIGGVFIPEFILGNSFLAKINNFERSFLDGTPIDAIRLIDCKIFQQLGGFDEKTFVSGSGEDWDLSLRVSQVSKTISISRDNNLDYSKLTENHSNESFNQLDGMVGIFHDQCDLTFSSYLRKKMYYSQAFKMYRQKWNGNSSVKKQFSWLFRIILLFWNKKSIYRTLRSFHLYLGIVIIKICLAVAVLAQQLFKKDKNVYDIYSGGQN